jgi:hypothetical protein
MINPIAGPDAKKYLDKAKSLFEIWKMEENEGI